MKNKYFKTGRLIDWSSGKRENQSISEWSEHFMTYEMFYHNSSRIEDFVAIARMFAWTLKKMGVTYKSYKEMDEDGVPLLIQQVWFDDSKLQ